MKSAGTRITTLAVLGMVASPLFSSEASRLPTPHYTRPHDQAEIVQRPPRRTPLPAGLRGKVEKATPRPVTHGAAATRPPATRGTPPAPRPRDLSGLEARASAAGARAATDALRVGERQYFRTGFYLGLREGLAHFAVSPRYFSDGRRSGRRDRQAYRIGEDEGVQAARQSAERSAGADVAAQFHDLSWQPAHEPVVDVPHFEATVPRVPPPTLREVFDDFGWDRVALSPNGNRYLATRDRSGWALSQCAGYEELLDGAWDDSEAAFHDWVSSAARARRIDRLGQAQVEHLRELFQREYRRGVRQGFDRVLIPLYDQAFDEGWSHAARVRREHEWRLGYHEGYLEAYAAASQVAFADVYPDAYERAYADEFTEWDRSARPAIGDLLLRDDDGDGLFQPGERVWLDLELLNFGGRAASFRVDVDAPQLAEPSSARVRLPARRTTAPPPVELRLRDDLRSRTRARIRVELAGERRDVSVEVRFPLEIERRGPVAYRANLDGELVIRPMVTNLGGLPRDARLSLSLPSRPELRQVVELGEMAPGVLREAELLVDRLAPLDLIAGDVTLVLRVEHAGLVQDEWVYRVPGVALDPAHPDLPLYLGRLATANRVDSRELVRARELLRLRLVRDWELAVRERGNPYKLDYRNQGDRTALGELVRLTSAQGEVADTSPVFAGLSGDVLDLADELPGVHPFLRKYVRRLARRLP